MKSIRNIVCAIDFSDPARNALKYAIRLADYYGAEITLLHVIELPPDTAPVVPTTGNAVSTQLLEDAKENLQRIPRDTLGEIAAMLQKDPIFTTRVEVGPVGMTVNDFAESAAADLIVIGSQGEEDRSWWSTSATNAIIDHPKVPVLVIPAMAAYQSWEKIAYATDLRRAEVAHLLEIIQFLHPQRPTLQCLHVVEDPNETTEMDFQQFIDVFRESDPDAHLTFHRSEENDLTEALEAFTLIQHADLQILVRPRRNFFQELFRSSQTKKTAGYTHVPLLVWPE